MLRLIVSVMGGLLVLPAAVRAQDGNALAQRCRLEAFRQVGGGVQPVELVTRLQDQCIRRGGPAGGTEGRLSASRTAQRTAVVGKPLKLDHHMSLNPDCTSMGYPEARIIKPGSIGTVSTRKAADFSLFPASNARHVCNAKRASATQVWYVASRAGSDTVSTRVIFPSGNAVTRTYVIEAVR
ncbi:hypothetical protein [Salinarimonas soli]|nr:hypothetical protein [Salinarimonas soli]